MREELMSSTVSQSQTISRITIAALEDVGYPVDYSRANSFTSDDLDPSCRCDAGRQLTTTSHVRAHPTWIQEQDHSQEQQQQPNKNDHRRRRLSDEGLQKAEEYGRAFIARNAPNKPIAENSEDIFFANEEDYIVGGSARVSYYENGQVFVVDVMAA